MRVSFHAVTLALCLTVLATPAAAGDIWKTSDGKMQGNSKAEDPPKAADFRESKYSIVDERLDVIQYKIENVAQPQSYPADKIVDVWYDPDNKPPEMLDAEKAEQDGDWAAARDAWTRMERGAKLPWAKKLGAYRAALMFSYEGNAKAAADALGAFKKEYPDSRHVPAATRARARALLAIDDVTAAQEEFAAIKKIPGLSEAEGLEADYWVAWIDEKVATEKNDKTLFKKALEMYKSLKGRLASLSDNRSKGLLARCEVGIAACQLGLGDWKSALDDLTKLVEKATDPQALAGIHTMLGNALLAKNTASGAPDIAVYRTALDHFLRVVTLYGPTEGAEEFFAESLYKAGSMFYELRPVGKDPASEEKRKLWGMYARREWRECMDRFPNSSWARRAKAEAGR